MSPKTVAEAKSLAKALRAECAARGAPISHAQALEWIAHQNGARDWNTLHARLSRPAPEPMKLGEAVRGTYLGQPFTGRIVALSRVGVETTLTLQLDQPVDVVRFASFSNLRRRISGTVGADGCSEERTSDGQPQLVVVRAGG